MNGSKNSKRNNFLFNYISNIVKVNKLQNMY